MPQSDSGHLAGRGATADGPWWPWHRTLGSGPDCHGAQRPGEAPLSLVSLLDQGDELGQRVPSRAPRFELRLSTAPQSAPGTAPRHGMQAHPLLTNHFPFVPCLYRENKGAHGIGRHCSEWQGLNRSVDEFAVF